MECNCPYEALELTEEATENEIKMAFKGLIL